MKLKLENAGEEFYVEFQEDRDKLRDIFSKYVKFIESEKEENILKFVNIYQSKKILCFKMKLFLKKIIYEN